MNTENTILEEGLQQDNPSAHYMPASIGQRFANYIIDLIVIYAFVFIITFGISMIDPYIIERNEILFTVFFYVGWLFYYFICEMNFGKTAGKMITRTMVVTNSGEPVSAKVAFIRTISRLVPFEALSVFFSNDREMWHDRWADSLVVQVPR